MSLTEAICRPVRCLNCSVEFDTRSVSLKNPNQIWVEGLRKSPVCQSGG